MAWAALAEQLILLIEDDRPVAQGLPEQLECMGARVIRTPLRHAAKILRERRPSAAVFDRVPTSAERRALVRLLKYFSVPVLFHGAEAPGNATTERHALFIATPCPVDKLVSAIRYLVGV